ncbi:MAG: zinc-binding dehydrogenase [Bacteroidetes bacterium]|nr:zinc-binding dehydrogenase [Bacteroidota bacterium]
MIKVSLGIGIKLMAKTFKAATLVKITEPLKILELEIPKLIPGQVLIKNIYSGVCRSQLMEVLGLRGHDKWVPHLLGHEAVGIVEEISESITKVRPGDKVVSSWIRGEGIQTKNPNFTTIDGLKVNSGAITTFSEYTVTSECFVTHAPVGFKDEFLPLFGCSFLTGAGMALHNLTNSLKKVAVIGFGGVGSAAAITATSFTNLEVIIIEESEKRRNLARLVGFKDVIDISESKKYFGQLDLVLEAGGSKESIELGFNLLTRSGKLIFASHPPFGTKIEIDPHELLKGKMVIGSWGGGLNLDQGIISVSGILRASEMNYHLLPGEIFDLSEVGKALNYISTGLPGRSLIRLTNEEN